MLRSLRNKASSLSASSRQSASSGDTPSYDTVLNQVHAFEIALQAMDLLLDDRNEEGTRLLKAERAKHKQQNPDPAAIFPLALGVMEFIEATLGFETDVMNRARKTLTEAEEASSAHSKYNQKHNINTSHIYPPGTEFQVTYAESTLLNALVMLLQENNTMMEQAKALLKLRKAYQILDSTYKKIKESEPLFNKNLQKFRKQAESHSVSSVDLPGFDISAPDSTSLPEDKKLMLNLERVYQMRKNRIEGTSIALPSARVNLFQNASSSSVSVQRASSPNSNSTHRSLRETSSGVKSNSQFLREPSKKEDSVEENDSTHNVSSSSSRDDDADADADSDQSDTDTNSAIFADTTDHFDPSCDISDTMFGVLNLSPKIQDIPDSILSVDTSISSIATASESHLHVSTIDEFIHSGVQLCFGILQVVLSLIPPAIGKVLSIVGFKGDRLTGLHMLWRTAITARNIHGDLALLFLLIFYDGPIQFVDTGYRLPGRNDSEVKNVLSLNDMSTVSSSELNQIIDNPHLYTAQLLKKARVLFPNNGLWILQEGRMLAAQGNIYEALTSMQSFTDNPASHIEMDQIEAIFTFDRAMLYAFVHDFDNAARDFIHMLDISSWSSSVYLFMAGACYLEKWRMIQLNMIEFKTLDEKTSKLKFYEAKAEKFLKLAPTYIPGIGSNASKKGGIGGSSKQMPFDKFVLRKTKQIEARQKTWPNLSYLECVGTSLILELIYFWNGYLRMPPSNLRNSIELLDYSGGSFAKFPETMDERMIRNFFQAVALKQLGEVHEGSSKLSSAVISEYVTHDTGSSIKFVKMTYSPYLYPTALYEKASFIWESRSKVDRDAAVTESFSWLKKAEQVSETGDYELSTRTSMRIKAAMERLEQVKNIIKKEKSHK